MQNDIVCHEIVRRPSYWSNIFSTQIFQELLLFKEAVGILRQGESHVVPLFLGYSGGIMDYRVQNFHVPGSEQIVKHFEHIWWDPDAPLPRD